MFDNKITIKPKTYKHLQLEADYKITKNESFYNPTP